MQPLLETLLALAPPGSRLSIRITVPPTISRPQPAQEPDCTDWTTEQKLEWVRQTIPEGRLKLKEWARLLAIPVLELERAVEHGLLQVARKGYQRDHAALVLQLDEVEVYAQTRPCRKVRNGKTAAQK